MLITLEAESHSGQNRSSAIFVKKVTAIMLCVIWLMVSCFVTDNILNI